MAERVSGGQRAAGAVLVAWEGRMGFPPEQEISNRGESPKIRCIL